MRLSYHSPFLLDKLSSATFRATEFNTVRVGMANSIAVLYVSPHPIHETCYYFILFKLRGYPLILVSAS